MPASDGRLLPVSVVMRRLTKHGYPASKSYIYKLIDMGEIQSIRVGSRKGIRIREDWLDQYIKEKETAISF
jgi:excisionase family DNA binding protein